MTLRCHCSRRDFLRRGLYGITIGAGLPAILNETSAALAAQALQGTSIEAHPERILVVVELSGGSTTSTSISCGRSGRASRSRIVYLYSVRLSL